MYEDLFSFVKNKENFSPTICYDIISSLFVCDYYNKDKIQAIYNKQNVTSIDCIDYSLLSLNEVFTVLVGVYSQANNLVFPSMMFSTGKLEKIINRLEQLDVEPEGNFDERKYLLLRNMIITACSESAFTKNRIIIEHGTLLFFLDDKELSKVEKEIPFAEKELYIYLDAIEKHGWINALKLEYVERWVVYPGERMLKVFNS